MVYPLYALNCKSFNDARRIPRFEFDVAESEDLNAFADGLNKLVDIGFRIPKQWAHDKLQVPVAAEGEEVLAKVAPNPTAYLNAKPEGKMAVLSVQRDPEELLENLEPTAEDYQAVIDPMLKPVVEALQKGGYEFAQEKLATLYAEMNDEELETLLTRAIFVSDLLGRANAKR